MSNYACVYIIPGADRRAAYQHWYDICKRYRIRTISITNAYDLPTIFKQYNVGASFPNLICICNSYEEVNWFDIQVECRDCIILETLPVISTAEDADLQSFFDARVKFVKGKHSKVYIKKQPNAPDLPSAQLKWEQDRRELREEVDACIKFEHEIYIPEVEKASNFIFDLVNTRYAEMLQQIIDLSRAYDKFYVLRDFDTCEGYRRRIVAHAKTYVTWANGNLQHTAERLHSIVNQKKLDFAIDYPAYARGYMRPDQSDDTTDDYVRAIKRKIEKLLEGLGLNLFYEDTKDFLTQIGMSTYLEVTKFPEPPKKRQRIVGHPEYDF